MSDFRATCSLPLPPKINAPQHDSRRRAFELRRLIFASGAGFDAFAQARELLFPFARPGARAALEVVHGGGRDRAADLLRAVLHRELDDAAVLVVGDEAAGGECHGVLLLRPRVVPALCAMAHGGRGSALSKHDVAQGCTTMRFGGYGSRLRAQ